MGGLGFVKTSSQVACVLATTGCARGQYALVGACASCGSGQSSPNGIRCVFWVVQAEPRLLGLPLGDPVCEDSECWAGGCQQTTCMA